MAIIVKELTVNAPPSKVWALVEDPSLWPTWFTPIRALEERVNGPIREGLEFHFTMGRLGGAKMKVKEVVPNQRVRWNGGPPMAHMMGMTMRGTLELRPFDSGSTRVTLRMVTPMMMAPMMKMMSGLNAKEEIDKSIKELKRQAEK